VKASWIEDCIRDKAFRPFVPQDLYFAKKSTQDILSLTYDIYGDSHTEKRSFHQMKELIRSVIQTHVIPEKPPSASEMKAIKRQVNLDLFGDATKMDKYSFFEDCRIAFREEPELITRAQVEFYGATVLAEEWEPSVTHVILPPNAVEAGHTEKLNSSAFLLKSAWIQDCIAERKCLSEVGYMVEG